MKGHKAMTTKGQSSKTSSAKQEPKSTASKSKEPQASPSDETQDEAPRDLTAKERKQIDNEPGYSTEQLDQMSEYYGTSKTTVAEVPTIERTHLAQSS